MKKILLLSAILVMIGCSIGVFADVVTTTRKLNPQPEESYTTERQNTTPYTRYNEINQNPARKTGSKLADSVMMCKPYSESLNTPVSGINFRFDVKIHGWVNNKCRLTFTANSTGISNMFSGLYGIDPSMAQISTFEPKVNCEFTKQQLAYVGDSILQEQERNSGASNNMLKSPDEIIMPNFGSMSESDSKLLEIILNEKACQILNAPDTTQMIESLF